jgi:hypothetical protein
MDLMEESGKVIVKLGLGYSNLVFLVTDDAPSITNARNGLVALLWGKN